MSKHGHGKGGRRVFTEEQEVQILAWRDEGFTRQEITQKVLDDFQIHVHYNTIQGVYNRDRERKAQALRIARRLRRNGGYVA